MSRWLQCVGGLTWFLCTGMACGGTVSTDPPGQGDSGTQGGAAGGGATGGNAGASGGATGGSSGKGGTGGTSGTAGSGGVGGTACSAEGAWRWTSQKIDEMRLVPQGAVPVEGETVRLEAKLLYTSCDRFLGVTARVDPGTQTIKVSANLLKRPDVDNCLGELELGHDIQVLGTLSPGTWTVSAYYGGGPMFTFEVAPCPAGKDCLCTQTKPDLPFGAECRYHCECSGDNVCVRSFGEGGQPQAECRPSCAVDAQCAPGFTCVRGGDSPDLVCQPTFSGAVAILCEGDADCSKEDSCHTWPNGARSCEPRPDDMDKHASERCECTEQCESLSCVVAEGEDMWWNECRLPCRGQRDCPPGRTCGAGTIWSEPVCS